MDRLLLALYSAPAFVMLVIGIIAIETGSSRERAEVHAHDASALLHESELVPAPALYIDERARSAAQERQDAVLRVPECVHTCEPSPTVSVVSPTVESASVESASAASVAAPLPTPTPVPIAPAPAPTPAPQPYVASASSGCPALIASSLGAAGCMISFCESTWDPNATGLEGERGWFQVHPRWHADATYDPAGNVASAVRISRGGADWSQWTTQSVLWTGVCPSGRVYPG